VLSVLCLLLLVLLLVLLVFLLLLVFAVLGGVNLQLLVLAAVPLLLRGARPGHVAGGAVVAPRPLVVQAFVVETAVNVVVVMLTIATVFTRQFVLRLDGVMGWNGTLGVLLRRG